MTAGTRYAIEWRPAYPAQTPWQQSPAAYDSMTAAALVAVSLDGTDIKTRIVPVQGREGRS